MARKVILVGEYGDKIHLTETETITDMSPPKEYGWCARAVFRRFEGLKDGKPVEVIIWEGKAKEKEARG